MGYEALRQKWQNLSPFSTGACLAGRMAATNLALYGTGSIGYLGAMMEKTNVDKILKLDLLKTDFFGADAYPTYLLFNPYGIVQSVQIDAGNNPVDVYEALSETFPLKNVSGTVSLTIPANQAVLVTLTPAGGAVTFDKNKMLVDGVVVDFNQHAQPYTYAPRIKALAAAKVLLESGDSTAVYATVEDADSGQITYNWTVTAGAISVAAPQLTLSPLPFPPPRKSGSLPPTRREQRHGDFAGIRGSGDQRCAGNHGNPKKRGLPGAQ